LAILYLILSIYWPCYIIQYVYINSITKYKSWLISLRSNWLASRRRYFQHRSCDHSLACMRSMHIYVCTSDCLQVTWHESQYYYYHRIWYPIFIPLEHGLSAMADSQHWLLLIMWLTTCCHKHDLFFVDHACGWHLFANYTVSCMYFLRVLNHFWCVLQLHISLKYLLTWFSDWKMFKML
jgi:hypothetical protein